MGMLLSLTSSLTGGEVMRNLDKEVFPAPGRPTSPMRHIRVGSKVGFGVVVADDESIAGVASQGEGWN